MPIRTATLRDPSRREYLARKGAEALALGDREEALRRYRAALECDPDDDALRMAAAQLEAAVGDPRLAAASLVEAIERRPAHPEAWNLLGAMLFEQGERAASRSCFARAQALAPGLAVAKRNLKRASQARRRDGALDLLGQERRQRLLARRAPRLTVCLIARDEERMLAGCLDSIAAVADQIVLVDTGSTDRTVDLARAHGAQVFTHAWQDDFSAARNEALRHARGDWILMLDADERLFAEDRTALRTFVERGGADYASLRIESSVAGETMPTRAIRLYRNYPGLRYVGRVHEQILPALRGVEERFPLRSGDAPVRLRHLGYEPEIFLERGKGDRNRALVEAEVSANPENAYARLKQGELLFVEGRLQEAAPQVEAAWHLTLRALAQGASAELLEEPATLRAACAVGEAKYELALETLQRFHEHCAPTANTSYLEGIALHALAREGAREKLLAAIAGAERSRELFTLPEIRGASPRWLLGTLCLGERELAQARAWFEQALALDPTHREARLGLAEALFLDGCPARALECLAAQLAAHPQDLKAWQLGALYLVGTPGQEAAARAWIDAGRGPFPEDAVLHKLGCDLAARGAAVMVG